MSRLFATAMMIGVIIWGCYSVHTVEVFAADYEATTESTYDISETSESDTETSEDQNVAEEDEDEPDEDAEVLGANREKTSNFVVGIEIAICIIFAIGLVAAGKGGYEN